MSRSVLRNVPAAVSVLAILGLWACGEGAGIELGRDLLAGPSASLPATLNPPLPPVDDPGRAPSGKTSTGSSCKTGDPNRICLGVKYVVYKDASDKEVLSEAAAENNIKTINNVWQQCNIAFQMDEYLAIDPADYGLQLQTSNYTELDLIRKRFADSSKILIITTGSWNRSGSLGNTSANAWTAMPGGPPYGAVLEKSVAGYGNIIAHELGHYLNLLHVGDTSSLMNPIIYSYSTKVAPEHCNAARAAAGYFWSKMLR